MEQPEPTGISMLEKRIREPETAERLSRLLDRLDSLEKALDAVETAVQQGPAFVSTLADIADEAADRAQSSGIDVDQRLRLVLGLAEQLTEPRTIEALSGLLDRMDRIEQLSRLADELPHHISMMVDTIDEIYQGAANVGIDIDARVRSTFSLGEKLTSPDTVDALDNVLDAGAVNIVGMIGQTLARCHRECMARPEPYSATLVDFLRATRDPDVRHALGFLTNFARLFGRGMVERHAEQKKELARTAS